MSTKDKNSVLIVDDEKANCIAIAQILKNEYTVYVSTDGYEAIEVAKKTQPDVILLDILMPELDGYAVIKILKNSFETKNIPVIFVTGLTTDEDEEKGLTLGAEDYINKPFSPAIVKLRVQKIIQTLNQIEIIKQLSSININASNLCSADDFHERIKLMWDHAKLTKTTVSVLLMSIINFQSLIDQLGGQQSNMALHLVTKVIEQSFINSIGVISQLGGAKFGIILLDYDKQKSLDIANNIKKNVEKTIKTFIRGRVIDIVVCIGVTSYFHTTEHLNPINSNLSVDDFIGIAEQTLVTSERRFKVVQTFCE